MNRRSAATYDSDDSASDWDTTVAESPDRAKPSPLNNANITTDGVYATVVPRVKTNFRDGSANNSEWSSKSKPSPVATPRKEKLINEDHYSVPSPPPHMSSFKNALSSDYSEEHNQSPDVPPRMYDGKGKVYKVPDSTSTAFPQVTINWDDNEADEEILRELRQNINKEKQKQEAKQEALAQENLGLSHLAAENQNGMPSPRSARSQKSIAERRLNDRKDNITALRPKVVDPQSGDGNIKEHKADPLRSDPEKKYKKQTKRERDIIKPLMVRDATGKKCVYYFEEGSHHLLQVVEDDDEAFLPDKIEEVELLFKRVWREVFSILRVITSFIVLFITEFIYYLIHYLFQPLILNSLTAVGNHLLKPLMIILFNHFGQPIFAFIWNILNALIMAVNPILELLYGFVKQVAILLQSIRLFHISYYQDSTSTRNKLETV